MRIMWLIGVVIGCGLMVGCAGEPAGDGADVSEPAAAAAQPPGGAESEAESGVVDFQANGVLVLATTFFDVVGERVDVRDVIVNLADGATSDLAFVTGDGVYAFLETPENLEALKGIAPGSSVRLVGKLLREGRLLHVDDAEAAEGLGFDTGGIAASAGEAVTLTGTNKCMCGISIAEMHTSCTLGHLHHLVAEDGQIYQYLQFAAGKDATATMQYHFANVTVTGLLLPGHFLLVDEIETN